MAKRALFGLSIAVVSACTSGPAPMATLDIASEATRTETAVAASEAGSPPKDAPAATDSTGLPQEVINQLKSRAIGFADADLPNAGDEDFRALRSMIGDARVVALGEATHGTQEFHNTRRRIVEFLVDQMGFTVLAIEDGLIEAAAIDDFLESGSGDPAALLQGLRYWPWKTQSILELIGWMQLRNEALGAGPRLRFAGVDQDLDGSVPAEMTRVDAVKPDPAAKLNARDSVMAENALWWLDHLGNDGRLIVWAHNGHIQTSEMPFGEAVYIPMGRHLRQALGQDYVAIGFTYAEGSFHAIDERAPAGDPHKPGIRRAYPLPGDSHEALMQAAGLPRFYLDLRALPPDTAIANWLGSSRWMHFAGASLDESQLESAAVELTLSDAFDVIFYFDESTPSLLLPGIAEDATVTPLPSALEP